MLNSKVTIEKITSVLAVYLPKNIKYPSNVL